MILQGPIRTGEGDIFIPFQFSAPQDRMANIICPIGDRL